LQHKKIGTKTRQNIWMERANFLLQHHCSVSYNIHSSSCNIETMLLQHQIHAGATRKKYLHKINPHEGQPNGNMNLNLNISNQPLQH